MRYIKYGIDIGYCGCGDEGVISVPDNYDDNNIDMMVNDMAHEYADSWEGDQRLGFDDDVSEEEYEQQVEDFRANVSGWWEWATDQDLDDYLMLEDALDAAETNQ